MATQYTPFDDNRDHIFNEEEFELGLLRGPKLTGTENFIIWNKNLIEHCKLGRVWGLVSGQKKPPIQVHNSAIESLHPPPSPLGRDLRDPVFYGWKNLDGKLCKYISMTLDRQISIRATENCARLYEELCGTYQPKREEVPYCPEKDSLMIPRITRRLYRMELRDFHSVQDYAREFVELQKQLTAIRATCRVPQWMLNTFFINGLGDGYESLQSYFETQERFTNPDVNMHWPEMVASAMNREYSLKIEEQRRSQNVAAGASSQMSEIGPVCDSCSWCKEPICDNQTTEFCRGTEMINEYTLRIMRKRARDESCKEEPPAKRIR
ncbi:hypothetical protein N7454_005322 [Penicillium verhagenii]|nr:hypothetical protein N7454_005322 [Penicillium verhagenii]